MLVLLCMQQNLYFIILEARLHDLEGVFHALCNTQHREQLTVRFKRKLFTIYGSLQMSAAVYERFTVECVALINNLMHRFTTCSLLALRNETPWCF